MKKITKITSAAAVALMMVLTNGCKKEEMTPPSSSSAMAAEKITPSPGDHDAAHPAEISIRLFGSNPTHFTALDFTIVGVSLHVINGNGMIPINKWISIPQPTPHLINILKFNALSPIILANMNMPDGAITEIRIDFSKRGIVSWNERGVDHTLKAPFSSTSVIVPANIALKHGTIANIMLALDVTNTVNMEDGVNPVLLTPVIKARNLVFGKTGEAIDPTIE